MQDWTQKGKNIALSNGTLSQRGDAHWTRQAEAITWRKERSVQLHNEIISGKRLVLRDPQTGQIKGTRIVT